MDRENNRPYELLVTYLRRLQAEMTDEITGGVIKNYELSSRNSVFASKSNKARSENTYLMNRVAKLQEAFDIKRYVNLQLLVID